MTRLLLMALLAIAPASAFPDIADNLTNRSSGEHSLVSGGLTRTFLLHVPERLPPKAALVVVMHGYTGSAKNIMAYSGMNQVADQHGFVVVYPQGTIDQEGNAFFNVGYDFHTESSVDDMKFVRELVVSVQNKFDLDHDKTFATGMSNGADMSYLLACQAADLFRAIAPIAGVMMEETFDSCVPSRPLPVFEVHGTKDPISLYGGDMENTGGWGPYKDLPSTIALWVRLNSLTEQESSRLPDLDPDDGSHIVFDRYWSESTGNEVWFYRVVEGGHHWPGGEVKWWRSPLSWWYFRDRNQDINTSEAIWSFFQTMTNNR